MKATLTLDFSNRLNADEQRALLAETLDRQCRIEDVLVDALRMRRKLLSKAPPTDHRPRMTEGMAA